MKKFNDFKILESNNRYPYGLIWVELNSREELIELYDFLDTLLVNEKMSRKLLEANIKFPNYFCILSDIINDGLKMVIWFTNNFNDEMLDSYIYSNERSDKTIYTINDKKILKNIFLHGAKFVDYNKPRKLVYESKTQSYPYEYVVVKVEDKDEFIKLYDFLDNLKNRKIDRELLNYVQMYPNYIFIDTDYTISPESISNVRYLGNMNIDNSTLTKYIFDDQNVDSDILTASNSNLNILKNILTIGSRKIINYNEPRKLVYESNSNPYPYIKVVIEVNSYDDITEIYNYLEKILNIDLNVKISQNLIESYPNYIFVPTSKNNISSNNSLTYLGNVFTTRSYDLCITDQPTIDKDILTMDELYLLKSIIFEGKKQPKINYNEPRKLVYESVDENDEDEIQLTEFVVKVNNKDELTELYDYIDQLLFNNKIDIKLSRHLLENIEFYPNYIFVEFNLISEHSRFLGAISSDEVTDILYDKYITNFPSTYKNILTINDKLKIKNFLIYGSPFLSIKYNEPRKLLYESVDDDEELIEFVVEVNNEEELTELYDYVDLIYSQKNINVRMVRNLLDNIQYYPNFIFVNFDQLSTYSTYFSVISNEKISERSYDLYITDCPTTYKKIFTIKDKSKIKKMLIDGYPINSIDYNKSRKLVYESIESKNTLYAFDLDETLVYSDRFEDKVKELLVEKITPKEILLGKLRQYGLNLHDLKYENGRIYFNDPKQEFKIDDYNVDLVRKKDRIYLTQPEEYLLTDDSMSVGGYDKIINLYNSVENKCIITVRDEKLRSRTMEELKSHDINYPNYGLFMFDGNKFSVKSKYKSDTLIMLYKENNLSEIRYFDDNIKLLKKMKTYLSDFDFNIKLYKVTKNDYREI